MSTPVLRYYIIKEEVTLQCDVSQKELLAVVFACDHFDAYIYGRNKIQIETDHKPLESIVQKPLHSVPKRLQRIFLQL